MHPSLNLYPSKLQKNQYVGMKHMKSIHNIEIYVETQFGKTTSNMLPYFSPFWSDAMLKVCPIKSYNTLLDVTLLKDFNTLLGVCMVKGL